MSEARAIGAAVVGCGNISGVHLDVIHSSPVARLVYLYDVKGERAEAKAAQYGGTPAGSYDEILDDPAIEAVHILTPHAFHAGQALAALRHGKHVLCEKPMAVSVPEALELIRADARGYKLCVIFQNRYNPSTVMAEQIIASKEYGRIVSIKAEMTWHRDASYYSDDWHGKLALECGGVLINQAIHTVDMMLHLGGKPRRIKGSVSTDLLRGAIEVEDNAHAVIEYEGGHTGLLYASNNFGVDEVPEVRIVLENAVLAHRGDELYITRPDGHTELICAKTDTGKAFGKFVYGTSHARQINEFYNDIATGARHTITSAEAYTAVWAVSSVYESSRTGEWVEFIAPDLPKYEKI